LIFVLIEKTPIGAPPDWRTTLKKPQFGVGDVVAVDGTDHGSYVGARSHKSTPYKGGAKKFNAEGTYEVTPLTGYATTRTEKKTNL
jgi:hypothetical protein